MKRILVADDSVTIQKVIALTFADEPFEVQSVGTGSEALELMKSYTPDIVLADVIMPQMNGYELCRAIKQQETTASIPVLLLAGTFEAFDEGEAGSVGADDFITKPFESGELIDKVNTLLGEEAVASAAPEAPVAAPAAPATAPPVQAAPTPPAEPVAPPAAAPPSVTETGGPEPDIWDILSDTGDEAQAPAAVPPMEPAGPDAQGFGPIDDAGGVVDVGSFDVGLDRPAEIEPAVQAPQAVEPPPAPSPISVPEPPTPDPPADLTGTFEEAPAPEPGPSEPATPGPAPIVVEPPPMPDEIGLEKSQVENREKDFFGFETGAVEEVAGGDPLSEAVEEVTFDMDDTPVITPEASPEASFVVPEPAPEPIQEMDPVPAEYAPVAPAPEPPAFVPEPVPPAPPVPSSVEGSPVEGEPMPQPVAAPEPPHESVPPVLSSVEGSPVEGEPAAVLEKPAPDAVQAAGSVDDAAIRRIIEEKVEKIAWEVVPEMAEALIREALEKIKGGS